MFGHLVFDSKGKLTKRTDPRCHFRVKSTLPRQGATDIDATENRIVFRTTVLRKAAIRPGRGKPLPREVFTPTPVSKVVNAVNQLPEAAVNQLPEAAVNQLPEAAVNQLPEAAEDAEVIEISSADEDA